jgi:hypothetical protein
MIEFTKTFNNEAELMAFLESKQVVEEVNPQEAFNVEQIKHDAVLAERKAFIDFMERTHGMNSVKHWVDYYTPKILAGDDLATIPLPVGDKK